MCCICSATIWHLLGRIQSWFVPWLIFLTCFPCWHHLDHRNKEILPVVLFPCVLLPPSGCHLWMPVLVLLSHQSFWVCWCCRNVPFDYLQNSSELWSSLFPIGEGWSVSWRISGCVVDKILLYKALSLHLLSFHCGWVSDVSVLWWCAVPVCGYFLL